MTAAAPPRTLGKYELLSRLAVGGMAELFLARDSSAGKMVVIKRIHPYLCEEERVAGMFLDEARIASQLDHPNVVQILELGRAADSLFIAMEYVEGVDVSQLCEELQKEGRTLSFAIGAYLAAQVCAGLDHAHNRTGRDGLPLNIVHRDVNPKNVMVSFDGEVKLVDFGIAKARTMIEQTRPGTIKGKYEYFSPEQVEEAPVDRRTDIFALGITLYEITTGKSPFHRSSIDAMLNAICSEAVPAPELARSDYPRALGAIVSRCLMKDPRERYQRASEVQADLEKFLHLTDERSASRALSQYMATVYRRGDDPTLPFVPWATHKASLAEALSIPPLRAETADRPSPKLLDAAQAFARDLANVPAEERPPPPPALGTLPPTVRTGGAAQRSRASSTNSSPEPAGRFPLPGRVVIAGAVAAAMVLALLAVVALRSRSSTTDPPPLTVPLPELPAEPRPIEPVKVEPPPVASPDPPAPVTVTRVAVTFNGQKGLPITRDRRRHLKAGAVEQLKPGSYRLLYRCPGKSRGKARYKALTVIVPNTSRTMEVAWPCR